MLAGKRALRVGDEILKEIAFLLLERVKDPRVRRVTLTGIRLSDDLRLARIYYSVMGDSGVIEAARAGLDSAKGFIKREIGIRMTLRYVPEIRFIHDASLETGTQMDKLFEEMHKQKEQRGKDW
jgi:ribosome-binding factor A